jgi:hypothetical protein
LGRLDQTSIRLEVECVLMWTDLSGLARAEAIILVLFGKDGHLTNIMEQCSFSQKYLPFPPFERGSPHFGQSTIRLFLQYEMKSAAMLIEGYFVI